MVPVRYVDRHTSMVRGYEVAGPAVDLGFPSVLERVGHHEVAVALGGDVDGDAGGGVEPDIDGARGP